MNPISSSSSSSSSSFFPSITPISKRPLEKNSTDRAVEESQDIKKHKGPSADSSSSASGAHSSSTSNEQISAMDVDAPASSSSSSSSSSRKSIDEDDEKQAIQDTQKVTTRTFFALDQAYKRQVAKTRKWVEALKSCEFFNRFGIMSLKFSTHCSIIERAAKEVECQKRGMLRDRIADLVLSMKTSQDKLLIDQSKNRSAIELCSEMQTLAQLQIMVSLLWQQAAHLFSPSYSPLGDNSTELFDSGRFSHNWLTQSRDETTVKINNQLLPHMWPIIASYLDHPYELGCIFEVPFLAESSTLKINKESIIPIVLELLEHPRETKKITCLKIDCSSPNKPNLNGINTLFTNEQFSALLPFFQAIQSVELTGGLANSELQFIVSLYGKNLRKLFLRNVDHLSFYWAGIMRNPCPRLEMLGVSHLNHILCHNDWDKEFISRIEGCENLKQIYLNDEKLTGTSVQAIGQCFSKLQILEIGGKTIVKDEDLLQFARKRATLQGLIINDQKALTSTGFISVAKLLPKLERLKIVNSPGFTKDVMEAFRKHCPKLQILPPLPT